MGMKESNLAGLANSVRLRITHQVIEAVEADGYINIEDLAAVLERIKELAWRCEC